MSAEHDNTKRRSGCEHGGFADLPFAEQFLIWATRMWVLATARGHRIPPALQEGLRTAGVMEAAEPLDAFLWICCRHANRVPEFHAVRCPCLGRDERMLIRAMAAAQKGDEPAVRKELETLLPTEMAHAATSLIREAGHAFLCAGLHFERLLCRKRNPAAHRILVPMSRAIH